MKRSGVLLAANIVLALAYFWSGKFGLSLASFHASATPVWPPTGIALVAVLLGGYRLWPGILVGAFAVNMTLPGTVWTAGGVAVGNTLEALIGALLVNRFARGRHAFEQARTLIGFVVLAALLSTAICATIDVTTLCLAKVGSLAQSKNYGEVWLTWWLGDMVSAIVLAPLLLIWFGSPLPRLERKKAVEASLALFSLLLTGEILFRGWLLPWMKDYPLAFLSVPAVLWAAFRFRQHGASLAGLVLGAIALQGTVEGSGQFVSPSPNESLLLLQVFVGAITVMALVLAAAVSERTQAEQYLQTQYRVSQVLAEAAHSNEATPKILQSICETAGWQWGALWRVDEMAGKLRFVEAWHVATMEVPHFEATCKEHTFAKGIGLPGRIWAAAAPAWITDATKDSNFPRAPAAAKAGLHGAFGFPILLGGEVLGVIEFFSRTIRKPEENLLQMMGALGTQIGQFIERTRIEEDLRASEVRKAAVIESALDAVITIDGRGVILEYNPAAEKMFGFSRKKAVGQPMVDLIIPPSLREGHRRGLARYLTTGETSILGKRLELSALRADGTEFPVELSITQIPRAEEPLFTGYVRDITERRKAEAFLKKNEASLAKSQEMAHVGSWELDLAKATTTGPGPQLYWSDETFRIFGLKPRELEPSSELFYRLVHPEDRQRVRDAFHAAVAERKPYVCEHRIVRPNGECREVHQRADVICDETMGSPTRVVGTLQDITERKQAEEQSAFLAALVQSSGDAIISKDLAGTITTWNTGAERLFKYSSDEAVGRPIAIIIPLDRLQEERDIIERVRRGERVEHYETVRLRKDEVLLHMSLTVSPIWDSRGKIVGASKICRDITERKRVEEALRASEERLRLSQQVAHVGSFDWNIITGVSVWTPEMEEMYGLPPGGFAKTQAAWERLLHPDDRAAALQQVELAFQTGQLVEGEWRVIWPDGSVHWLAGRWQVFKDSQGEPVRMAGVNIDITERKRAEERFRLVVEAAPNAMIMVGREGRITLVNSQTEKLFGYARAELLGQPVEILVPERFRKSHGGFRESFFNQPQARAMGAGRDLFGLRKDGVEVPVEIGLNPIQTSEGTFVLASIIDITERKRAEELIQASLSEKEVLLQEIHHRVKNNMQVISSLLQLQAGYLENPQALEAFRESQARIRSMALIHEKLYQSESLAKIDLADYLQSLLGMLFRTYSSRSGVIRLETNIAPTFLGLDDAIPIGLVTHELVSNCLKYAFADGRDGVIRVELSRLPLPLPPAGAPLLTQPGQGEGGLGGRGTNVQPNEYALTVEDNGVGLPAGFDLEKERTLGLRLVQMFAKQIHGELTLVRAETKTKFALRFGDRTTENTTRNEDDTTHPGGGR